MKKSFFTFLFAVMLTLVSAVALAYNPGQRTIQLLGGTLNSDKHPVHLVVSQTIDLRDVLTSEAYNQLAPAKKRITNRTEYNEANGINAERITTTDGEGNITKDNVSFVKDGYWYSIDYLHKTYDRVPELPGMSIAFAETMINWFNNKPTMGNDANTGYDYDMMTKGISTLSFYYEKDTANWLGYKASYMPEFKVVEVSQTVDTATAFALPPADFKQVVDPAMRNYANRLLERQAK